MGHSRTGRPGSGNSRWQVPLRAYRLDAGGELDMVVDDWTGEYVMSPTNLAFAGDQLHVLVLASLCGWAVKAIDPGVAGVPVVRPKVVAGG